MKPTAKTLLLTSLLLTPVLGWSQSFLQQTFEANGNSNPPGTRTQLVYSNVGGQTYTGTFSQATSANNANTGPLTANVFSEGINSFGVVNNNGSGAISSTLTFDPVTFTATTGNYLTLRLASYRTNNNGGIDNGVTGGVTNNGIAIRIAYNGSTTFINTLEVRGGNQGSVFDYNAGGVASPAAVINAVPATPTIVTSPSDLDNAGNVPASGGAGTSTVRINFGAAITRIQVQVFLAATSKTAVFIDDVRIGSNGPLPVELTSFDAARQAGTVFLKWATASEKNNDRFEVQRSANGQEFLTIKTVQGSGTTAKGRSYTSTDAEPLAGVSYYRLLQVDRDGTVSYSPVRTVNAVVAVAYPNPAHDLLYLPTVAVGSSYRVYNTLGQTVLEGHVSATGAIKVQTIQPGNYFLRVGAGPDRATQHFIRE